MLGIAIRTLLGLGLLTFSGPFAYADEIQLPPYSTAVATASPALCGPEAWEFLNVLTEAPLCVKRISCRDVSLEPTSRLARGGVLSEEDLARYRQSVAVDSEQLVFISLDCRPIEETTEVVGAERILAVLADEDFRECFAGDAPTSQLWGQLCSAIEEVEVPVITATPTPIESPTSTVTPAESVSPTVTSVSITLPPVTTTAIPQVSPTSRQTVVPTTSIVTVPPAVSVAPSPTRNEAPSPTPDRNPTPTPNYISTPPTSVPTATPAETNTAPKATPGETPTPNSTPTPTAETPVFLGYHMLLSNIGAGPNNEPEKMAHRSVPEDPLDEWLFYSLDKPLPKGKESPPTEEIAEETKRENEYLERREEFRTNFESPLSPIYWTYENPPGSGQRWHEFVSYEEAANICSQKTPIGVQYKSRLLTVTEARYYGEYLAELLMKSAASKTNKCFFLAPGTEKGDTFAQIYCPYMRDGHIPDAKIRDFGSEPAAVFCVTPNKTPSDDNYELFEEGLKTIPPYKPRYHSEKLLKEDEDNLMAALDINAEDAMVWKAQVKGFRQYRDFQMIPELEGSGRWEAYLAYYVKNFGNANEIMETFKPGKNYCSLLWGFDNKYNFGITWKTLHTAFFTSYIAGGKCDKNKDRISFKFQSNFEYAKEMIKLVATSKIEVAPGIIKKFGFTNHMNSRRVLAQNIGDPCSGEFFSGKDHLYHHIITTPVCKFGPIMDMVPILGTAKLFAEAIVSTVENCKVPDSNCGADAAVLFGVAALSGALDILPGAGAIARASKATGRFLGTGARLAVKSPGKAASAVVRFMAKGMERAFQMTLVPSRVIKYALKNGLKDLYSVSLHGAALNNMRRGLSEIIGEGPVQAAVARDKLVAAGFGAEVITIEGHNMVHITSAPVGETWSRLSKQLAVLSREREITMEAASASVKAGKFRYKFLLDTERSRLKGQIGGAYNTEHRALFLLAEEVWSDGRGGIFIAHELRHLNDFDRVMRGLMSQYLGSVGGKFGPRATAFGYANWTFGEVKTYLGQTRAYLNVFDEFLRRFPQYADMTFAQALKESKQLRDLFLSALSSYRGAASFTLDLKDLAKAFLAKKGKDGERMITVNFMHRSEVPHLDASGWQHVDAYFAVFIAPDGRNIIIPLHYGAQFNLDVAKAIEKGMEAEAAKKFVFNTYLDARLNRLVEKGDAAEVVFKRWFTDSGDNVIPNYESLLKRKMKDISTDLRADSVAADAAQPKEFLELPPIPKDN